jgi:peptidyl-tRNA hydrolase
LYLVVRNDLKAGMQLAQTNHCSFLFAVEHPQETKEWMINSNYIAVLAIDNEEKLIELIEKAMMEKIRLSFFKEPDLNNQITAVALMAGEASKKLCGGLKLALKEVK